MALCIAGVLINGWLACNLLLRGAWQGRNDFLGFYAGAQLAGSPQLYDRDSIAKVQLRTVGDTFEIQYGRLPYYAWMLQPLGRLPYRTAYAIWVAMQAAAFAGFLALWPGGGGRTKWLAGCWSIPAFVCLFNGQDDLLLLCCAACAAWLLRGKKAIAAGLVLTLCASKYHLFMLAPLVIVAQRRWRMAAGMAMGGAIAAAASFAVGGGDWPRRYYEVLTHPGINTGLRHMPNLHSLMGMGRLGLTLQVAATLALAAGVYLAARRCKRFEEPLALALAAGVLIGYHGYLHDCSLFLPAIIALFGMAGSYLRIPAMVLASPAPWFMLQFQWPPLPAAAQILMLAAVAVSILAVAFGVSGRSGSLAAQPAG